MGQRPQAPYHRWLGWRSVVASTILEELQDLSDALIQGFQVQRRSRDPCGTRRLGQRPQTPYHRWLGWLVETCGEDATGCCGRMKENGIPDSNVLLVSL